MSDPVSVAVFHDTLIEVGVALLLIVPAYWRPCRWPVLIVAMLALVPLLCMRPATGVVVFAIFAAMWIGVWRRVPGWATVSIATVAALLALQSSIGIHRSIWTRIITLQQAYAEQDLHDRLRYEERAPREPEAPFPVEVTAAFETLPPPGQSGRRSALKNLHDGTFIRFISSGGFGVSRMGSYWEREMTLPEVDANPLPEPRPEPPAYPADFTANASDSPRRDSSPSPPDVNPPSTSPDERQAPDPAAYRTLATNKHRWAEVKFLDPDAWGYVTGKQTAIGFEPHAFRRDGRTEEPSGFVVNDGWQLVSLQLVSLLKHDQPMAYVSATLPNMQTLGEAPVRPLDPFETAALDSLRQREELVVESTTNRIRMLGALRAGKACLACHSVRQGSLLGAFSYRLDREAPRLEPRKVDLQ